MNISIIQSDIVWEDIQKNGSRFAKKIEHVPDDTRLIILPEMFLTGFSMNPQKFAGKTDRQLEWMAIQSAKKKAAVAGSIIREQQGIFYNTLVVMSPDGSYAQYDKRHLFRFAGEDQYYNAGSRRLIFEMDGVRFCPQICYDLRFPVWSRNQGDYDCLLYVANWPDSRSEVWKTLLRARAMENQSYVIGVNRVGTDGYGLNHSGFSQVIDPKGNILCQAKEGKEEIITADIDIKMLEKFRKKFPVKIDADDFKIL
ncbi:MAG: amidohydrolase [Bacteroidia bacterium]|nr:MAG: amidohydrolase [Bacteroidia bacterium]